MDAFVVDRLLLQSLLGNKLKFDCCGAATGCAAKDSVGEDEKLWYLPAIDHILFQEPSTIVFWVDGTRTVVNCADGDRFDHYMGFVAAVAKKLFGSTGVAKALVDNLSTTLRPSAKQIHKKLVGARADCQVLEEHAGEYAFGADQKKNTVDQHLEAIEEAVSEALNG